MQITRSRFYLIIILRSALRIEARTSRPMFKKKSSLLFLYTAYKSRGARYLLVNNPKTAFQVFTHPFRHTKYYGKMFSCFSPVPTCTFNISESNAAEPAIKAKCRHTCMRCTRC